MVHYREKPVQQGSYPGPICKWIEFIESGKFVGSVIGGRGESRGKAGEFMGEAIYEQIYP